jgi:hypothetical protein
MGEWWSYSVSDFLMFAPETYFRLLERHNAALWPAHLAAAAAAVLLPLLARRPGALVGRLLTLGLAVAWSFVAWAWFLERYAQIDLSAPYLAAGFAAQATLLAGFAVAGTPRFSWGAGARSWAGLGLLLFGLVLFPLLGPGLAGRPWVQAELFALTPDPTAIATLGLLLMTPAGARWVLAPLPLLWCGLSGLVALAMGDPLGWVTPAAGGLALLLMLGGRRWGSGAAAR